MPATTVIIRSVRIAGTDLVVYSAWEPSASVSTDDRHSHATITSHDEYGWIGTIASRRGDESYRDLEPGSAERIAAVEQRTAFLHELAVAEILVALPWLRDAGTVSGHEILTSVADRDAHADLDDDELDAGRYEIVVAR